MRLGKLFAALIFSSLICGQVFANDTAPEIDPLANITISKDQIAQSLAKMKSEGKITQVEYDAAKKELDGMTAHHVNMVKETALGMIRNNPDKALELVQAPKVNLEEAKRQINALSNPK